MRQSIYFKSHKVLSLAVIDTLSEKPEADPLQSDIRDQADNEDYRPKHSSIVLKFRSKIQI